MVILHVNKGGIHIRFTVIVPPLKACRMSVINRLPLKKPAEEFQIPLVLTFPFAPSVYKTVPSVRHFSSKNRDIFCSSCVLVSALTTKSCMYSWFRSCTASCIFFFLPTSQQTFSTQRYTCWHRLPVLSHL